MKKVLYAVAMLSCLDVTSAQDNDDIKLSGFFLGTGVNFNYDMSKIYNRNALVLNNGSILPANSKVGRTTDLSYGIHALLGYGHLFSNRIFAGIEQQIGIAHHPSESKSYITSDKNDCQSLKPLEFTTLAKLGYGFQSFPGIAYLSGGMKVLRINADSKKNIFRPAFGIGYQHGLTQHLSVRGDLLYTHISKVNLSQKINDVQVDFSAKGRRVSAMVTLAYTF